MHDAAVEALLLHRELVGPCRGTARAPGGGQEGRQQSEDSCCFTRISFGGMARDLATSALTHTGSLPAPTARPLGGSAGQWLPRGGWRMKWYECEEELPSPPDVRRNLGS
eukprot:scaffold3581_cov417-Prasinococcus_capsulatus_cf.AAC.6